MKPIIPILILALALVTTLAGAQTNTPGEQFQSAVATFQQSATEDNARKLAELLKQLDPPPAIPDEAKLHALKGTAFVKQTKIETDPAAFAALYAKAAAEYQAASTAAPWVGDYYFNRASCEKSAGQFAAATAALKLDLIFARTEQDRDANLALRAEIETKQEIAKDKQAAITEQAKRVSPESLAGDWEIVEATGGAYAPSPEWVFFRVKRLNDNELSVFRVMKMYDEVSNEKVGDEVLAYNLRISGNRLEGIQDEQWKVDWVVSADQKKITCNVRFIRIPNHLPASYVLRRR